jgi:SAM-dependent methyltransferase
MRGPDGTMSETIGHGRGDGYVTDVPYVRHFTSEMSPVLLVAAAALNGVETRANVARFDYCELGAGQGDTLATLAAAHPHGRFVGIDLLPEHVAAARARAERGGLANFYFEEGDFATLSEGELGTFDFVAAHGVLSWVSPETRRTFVRLAARLLRPGGLLYVSYNTYPGWAAIEPLRRLMMDVSRGIDGSLARAERAMQVSDALFTGGAAYFEENPNAKQMLARMARAGLPYVVHEYFHAAWHPMYFADVARELGDEGLAFVAQLPVYKNLRELTVPQKLIPLFAGIEDRVAAESLVDFATNEFFRYDLYTKGPAVRAEAVTRAYLDVACFGTLVSAAKVLREGRFTHGTLSYVGPLFEGIIEALAARPRTIAELAGLSGLGAYSVDQVRAAVLQLVFGEQVMPMPAEAPSSGRVAERYNRMVLGERLSRSHPYVLASPVAGTGIQLSMLEAVALRAITEVPPAGRAAWFAELAARERLDLRVGERAVVDKDERVAILAGEAEKMQVGELAKLVALGVVAPPAF